MRAEQDYDEIHDRLEAIIRNIVGTVFNHEGRSDFATVLLMLLVREGNTWKTIRFLMRQTQRELLDSVLIDVGTLLRAMFDAYLQAHYSNPRSGSATCSSQVVSELRTC
jgi:hypothetical protein